MGAMGHAAVTPERVMQYVWGYAPPLIMDAAVQNNVFQLLDEGPKTAEEVAAAAGAPVRGLRMILNALAGLQLVTKDSGGCYALTADSAAFLVPDKPGYLGGVVKHIGRRLVADWLHLNEVVTSGKPFDTVNQQGDGSAFFHELVTDIFPMSYLPAKRLAEELNIAERKGTTRVLDIAAGSGVWGIALAQQSQRVQVTAVDWPGVLPVTQATAAKFGLRQQFRFVAGDLRDAEFGTGYDVATLGHILHSEGERRSRALLRRVFDSLAPGGTLAIAEFLVDDERSSATLGLIFAVNMLVHTDEGDTFSFNEIAGWLREAGFREVRSLEAGGPSPLILATRP